MRAAYPDRSSCSFDLCCHWLDLRLGLSVQWSGETTLLSDCVCAAPILRLKSENRAVELAEQLSPFRLFLLT